MSAASIGKPRSVRAGTGTYIVPAAVADRIDQLDRLVKHLIKRFIIVIQLSETKANLLQDAFGAGDIEAATELVTEALPSLADRIAKLETIVEKYQKAMHFMGSAWGGGGRHGRPIDLLDKRTYQRMTELCIDARSAAEAAQ